MKLNSPKIAAVIAGIALLWAGSVPSGMAQANKPSAVPSTAVKPPASAPGSTVGTGTAASASKAGEGDSTQLAAAPRKTRRSRANEDARHCLALATNTAIIKCAEQYL